MSEIKVKYPIKAPIAAKLKSLCSEFSKVIADNCDDFVIRARVFSDDNASIKMRVLMSDVDGSLFIATFVLQDNVDKLLVSNRFSPKGGYAGRRSQPFPTSVGRAPYHSGRTYPPRR